MSQIGLLVVFAVVLVLLHPTLADDPSLLREDGTSHVRKPRFIYFHSRPHPKADEEKGIGFTGHLTNLLKGGTLGVEFMMPLNLNHKVEKWGGKFPFLSKAEMRNGDKEIIKEEKEFDKEEEKINGRENEWEDAKREGRNSEDDYGRLIDPRRRP